MKEYEVVAKMYNACAGAGRPQTFFEETELEKTDDYVRMKHGKEFSKFEKEIQDSQIIYRFDNGSITYVYEFTEI